MPSLPPTLSALHDAYRAGTLRPSEVVESWLARPLAERGNPVWISIVEPAVLRQRAATLDLALQTDREAALRQPLFGALYAVKDNIDVAGMQTTAACPAYAYVASASAIAVQQLDAAGAILVGKTNLDQFATGLVGTRSPYGAVPNAFRPEYISGGSSSGSAVAVARGLVHFALGTDTAGSGRVPAGLNNIVGWKPTRGLLSIKGLVPACRSLDCVAIFALTVADASLVFSVLAERREDADQRRHPLAPGRVPARFAFGVPLASQREFFGDAQAAAAFDASLAMMQALGGTAVPVDMTLLNRVAAMLYEGPWVAERHAAIRTFFDAQPDALDKTVGSIIGGAGRYTATDAFSAFARLDELRQQLSALWSQFDVLLVPTAPTIYTIAEVEADPVALNRRMGTYTNFVNLLDLAAMAVPSSLRPDGLPFGVTLIGPAGSDVALAELGARYQQAAACPLGATGAGLPPAAPLRARADVAMLAVVGAHLSGLPLNHQLTARGARLVRAARTARQYRLFRLPGTKPPKPGLVRLPERGGGSIELEVWELGLAEFGAFIAEIPAPLSIGTIELDDGSQVQGFLCEAAATAGAEEITHFGGWRNYVSRAEAA